MPKAIDSREVFDELKRKATSMETDGTERMTVLKSMKDAYKLVYEGQADVEKQFEDIKVVKDPRAYVLAKGIQRLLSPTKNIIKVPYEKNDSKMKTKRTEGDPQYPYDPSAEAEIVLTSFIG